MRKMMILNVQQPSNRIVSAKVVSIIALVSALAFAQPLSAQIASVAGEPVCSVTMLRGQYGWVGNGYLKLPDQNDPSKLVTVPSASIALLTFDGRGNFNLVIDVVFDGMLVRENYRVSDTYVVNPDCTGVLGSGIGPTFDILVPRDPATFLLIDKNLGGTAASEVKRIGK